LFTLPHYGSQQNAPNGVLRYEKMNCIIG